MGPTNPDLFFVWLCVAAGRPFLRARLDDDQAVEILGELLEAEHFHHVEFSAHLVDDERGRWTVIAHPVGIHQFDAGSVDHGCSS